MKFVPVRDFRVNPASIWHELEAEEQVVVTTNGQPTAVMLRTDADSLMDTLATIEQARWLTLITKMQTQVPDRARNLALSEINDEIAAARAGQ